MNLTCKILIALAIWLVASFVLGVFLGKLIHHCEDEDHHHPNNTP